MTYREYILKLVEEHKETKTKWNKRYFIIFFKTNFKGITGKTLSTCYSFYKQLMEEI